jgi:hypothetical protein
MLHYQRTCVSLHLRLETYAEQPPIRVLPQHDIAELDARCQNPVHGSFPSSDRITMDPK